MQIYSNQALNLFRNKNQRSTELKVCEINSFYKNTVYWTIETQNL